MEIYVAPLLFFGIAFVFSMLGMGGSQLYIPILFWLGMDFKTQAIPLGMLLNVVNSSSAAVTYGRSRLVEWRTALPFGILMVVAAPLGTLVNIAMPTHVDTGICDIYGCCGGSDAEWLEAQEGRAYIRRQGGAWHCGWWGIRLFCGVDRQGRWFVCGAASLYSGA